MCKIFSLILVLLIYNTGVSTMEKKHYHHLPDGTFRKGLDSKKINQLGWYPKIRLADGLKKVIEKRL